MRKSIILIFIIIYQLSFCQNFIQPEIIVPTVETFEISRLNYQPQNSGKFTYNFSISPDNRGVPILLTYNSGVRINDIGGALGMSWQINAGGAISRIVKDEADENSENWKPTKVNEATDLQNIRKAADGTNEVDTEYDWFYFSLSNGLSGSFYIDQNLQAHITSKDDLKITVVDKTIMPRSSGKLLEFIITGKDGTKYIFGGSDERIEHSRFTSRGSDKYYDTGWYLHQIKFVDNKEINFIYETEFISYYNSLDASFSIAKSCDSQQLLYSDITKSIALQNSKKPRLKIIYSDSARINFYYEKNRLDVLNSTASLLTKIAVNNNSKTTAIYELGYYDNLSPPNEAYFSISSYSTRYRHFLKNIRRVENNATMEFSYDRIDQLPPRFSLATDYYGYSNGQPNQSPFPKSGPENNIGLFDEYVPKQVISANKQVAPYLSSLGNLIKITHATKGVSEITYEPNGSMENVIEINRLKQSIVANYNACNNSGGEHVKKFTFISDGTPLNIMGASAFNDTVGCGAPDSLHDLQQLIIRDTNTNTIVFSTSRKIQDPINLKDFPTQTGTSYTIEYSVSSRYGAIDGILDIEYNTEIKNVIKEVFYGGSRVKQIKEYDSENQQYIKNIYYTTLDAIESKHTSINNTQKTFLYSSVFEKALLCQTHSSTFPEIRIEKGFMATTNNLFVGFTRVNEIFYRVITEVISGKNAIERSYYYGDDMTPYTIRRPEILFLPNTNNNSSFRNGILEKEVYYKYLNGKAEKSLEKFFTYNKLKEEVVRNFVFTENFTYTPNISDDPLINISYGSYENWYGFLLLSETKTIDYVKQSSVQFKDENYYNSNHHNQITDKTTVFHDGTQISTHFKYAYEKNNQKLIDANMVGIPLVTETKKDGITISRQETRFDDPSNLLPTSVLNYNMQNGTAVTEVNYDRYDPLNGNLLQYTSKSGIPTALIWGYGGTQPIAKVEGATYGQVEALAAEIIDLSNRDTDEGSEEAFLRALDRFRSNSQLSLFQTTTYTHDPLIGVTSITPPSGIREVYRYDDAGRLKSVTDVNGKVIKEHKYNYKQ